MFDGVITWWAEQMRSLLPAQSGLATRTAVMVRSTGQTGGWPSFEIAVRQRRGRARVGQLALGPDGVADARRILSRVRSAGPVVMELPGSMLLEQDVMLPMAAERELGAVLSHEMDRLTPFDAGSVFWSWAVIARNRAAGRLTVRLSLLPKMAVPNLDALGEAGLRIDGFELPGQDGAARRIGVASPALRSPQRRRALSVAGGVCAALAVAACVVPFARQALALSAADDQIAALRPRVAGVEALRRRLAASAGGAGLVAAEGARTGNALAALASLTRTLPDDTYLTELTLRARKLSITGRSDGAVRLIALLTSAQGLSNPSFAAPVMRMPGSRGDQFTIQAEVAP